VAPGCFAHPGRRAFWLGGGCDGRRAQGQGQGQWGSSLSCPWRGRIRPHQPLWVAVSTPLPQEMVPALCDTSTTFATHLCLSGLASRISHLSSLTLAWSCAYTRIGRALEGHELAGAELAQRHPVIWFQLRLLLVSAANSAM